MDARWKELVGAIADGPTREVVSKIITEVEESKSEILSKYGELKDFVDELDIRVRQQERYTSKDSIIVDNPPFDPRDERRFLSNVIHFLDKYLKVKISGSSLKAFHILPNKYLDRNIMPSVIIKFIYFNDKFEAYKNRRKLKYDDHKNPINGKTIWVKERLPPLDAYVKRLAESRGFVTTTHNCAVSVVCDTSSGRQRFIQVNNEKDLNALKNPRVKEMQRNDGRQFSNQKYAVQKKRQLSGGNQKDMFGSMSSEKKVYRENSTKNA